MAQKTFYHIYPLGLTGAPERNDLISEPFNRLFRIAEWIDHLENSGFNAVYFGPLFESESHGYDTVDYFCIDRRLGTNEDFKSICRSLKERGFAIYIDGVFNHVSRNFKAFRDLEEKRENSPYRDWFRDVSFDPFHVRCWEGCESLVELNLSNPEVKNHLFKAVEMWFREFGIDGLRLDVAYCLDKTFLSELRSFTRSLNGGFQLLGEVIHGDYREWLDTDLLDSVTNYECYKGIYSSLNDGNLHEIAYSLQRLFGEGGIYKGRMLYNFVDNHDVSRIASILKIPAHYYNALLLLFTMPGNPSIYYGSEWKIEGHKSSGDTVLRPSINCQDHPSGENEGAAERVVRQLSSLYRHSSALQEGLYTELMVSSEQLVFAREKDDDFVVCANNSSDRDVNLELTPWREGEYYDLLNKETVYTVHGKLNLHLWPRWGAILQYRSN